MTEVSYEIDWYPMRLAASMLGVSYSLLREEREILVSMKLIENTRGGLTPEAFECWVFFRKLVKERGKSRAIIDMKRKWNEQKVQGSGRPSEPREPEPKQEWQSFQWRGSY